MDVGDVFFPGASLQHAEEGRGRGIKGIPRDQVDWLRSDPGTPNLQETLVVPLATLGLLKALAEPTRFAGLSH